MDDFTLPYEPEAVDDVENHKRTILHFDIDCFYAQVSNNSLQKKRRYSFFKSK